MGEGKTIAFFPEACYGPVLDSVGIAQTREKLGNSGSGHRKTRSCLSFNLSVMGGSRERPLMTQSRHWT